MPIISGHIQANAGTIITIPANTSWIGSLAIAARTTPSAAVPYIEVFDAGANVQPPTGTKLLACALSNQITANNANISQVYVETGATSAVLRLQFDSATQAVGMASGYGAG